MAAATRAADYDVVVIDLDIHGLGSLGAIDRISRIENGPAVLAIDPLGSTWKDQAARAEGATDVLQWPVEEAKLHERLSTLAGRREKEPVEGTGRSSLRRAVPSDT